MAGRERGKTLFRQTRVNAPIDYKTLEDLLGSKREFEDIGAESESISSEDDNLHLQKLDEKLEDIQKDVFGNPTFLAEQKEKLRKNIMMKENLRRNQMAEEQMEREREARRRENAFQFDFGYLDAEVHELLQQLDSVYPDSCPMPDTYTTKSIYSTTRDNITKLGLKVILNRVCITGEYKVSNVSGSTHSQSRSSDSDDSVQKTFVETENIASRFIENLAKIRSRTDSVFASELGDITGCLLSYPRYFVAMFEGPELSIMDILHQGEKLFDECVSTGKVLFVAGHVLARYLPEWVDLVVQPPPTDKNVINREGTEEAIKQNLVDLCEASQNLWKKIANFKKKDIDLGSIKNDIFPQEGLIEFSLRCNLLRSLDTWIKQALELTYEDYTSESWPQIWYPLPLTAHVNDSQIDSLGVLNTYSEAVGLSNDLAEFLTAKIPWTPNDMNQE